MPRQAHGRSLSAAVVSRPPKRKPARSRNLDAFAIAQQESTSKFRVRPNRLGELQEDSQERRVYAKTDQEAGNRPAKRRRTHAQESSTSEDEGDGDSDGPEWHLGVDGDDEDSDIDSDVAMDESGEEKFANFAFLGSRNQSSKREVRTAGEDVINGSKNIDPQENLPGNSDVEYGDDHTDEDGLGEGAVDLATALDMNEEYEGGIEQTQRSCSKSAPQEPAETHTRTAHSNISSDLDTSASEYEHSALSISDDEDSDENHVRLKSFVRGLGDLPPAHAPSKRSGHPIAIGEPSEYGLASSQKLTIADLLPAVKDPRLRKSLKSLHNTEQKGSKVTTKGIPGKLDPPLAKRQQDRLDREAAYEKSKETLGRWVETVKQNRRAEHISFPLSNSDAHAALGTSKLIHTPQSNPFTPLASLIQSIMCESGVSSNNDPLAEENVQAFEELQEKKLPMEEVQIRRAELRKARDLMFREEIRARRIKKIKSKAYRRVHRKERDKYAQEERAALAAAGAVDSEDERLKKDRQRAEERMGARHKKSRWAREIKASGRVTWDADARLGVNDLARRDEELRKRIEGKDPTNSAGSMTDASDQESSDDISVDEYDEVEVLNLKQELGRVEGADLPDASLSRLTSMPFMRKADSARRAENKAEIEHTRRMLRGEDGEIDGASQSMADSGGRKGYGLRQGTQTEMAPRTDVRGEFEEPMSADDAENLGSVGEQPRQPFQVLLPQKAANANKVTMKHSNDSEKKTVTSNNSTNPWLCGPGNLKPEVATDKAIISPRNVLQGQRASRDSSKTSQLASKASVIPQSTAQVLTNPSDSEDETWAGFARHEQSAQRNEALVRMAFAGDEVFEAFNDEKKATVDEEGDQVVDTTLPGWGSWIGAGISRKEERRTRAQKTKTIIKGVDPDKRKDAKLDRVIINEKRIKKSTKYLAPELPHPFESRQQYERSLRLPLGPEWTTKTTFQDAIKPRVLLKQGIIRPMEKPVA